MSSRVVLILLTICLFTSARPVKKTLNFNMFVLQPHKEADRTVLSTDGVSRFGPILEYIVQRVQGMMSVRLPPEILNQSNPSKPDSELAVDVTEPELPVTNRVPEIPVADTAENEVDHNEQVIPGVVVRPSLTKPGTYEVEIDVIVDDEPLKMIPN